MQPRKNRGHGSGGCSSGGGSDCMCSNPSLGSSMAGSADDRGDGGATATGL